MTEFCYICDKFDFRCGGQACVVVVVGVGGGGGGGVGSVKRVGLSMWRS